MRTMPDSVHAYRAYVYVIYILLNLLYMSIGLIHLVAKAS